MTRNLEARWLFRSWLIHWFSGLIRDMRCSCHSAPGIRSFLVLSLEIAPLMVTRCYHSSKLPGHNIKCMRSIMSVCPLYKTHLSQKRTMAHFSHVSLARLFSCHCPTQSLAGGMRLLELPWICQESAWGEERVTLPEEYTPEQNCSFI